MSSLTMRVLAALVALAAIAPSAAGARAASQSEGRPDDRVVEALDALFDVREAAVAGGDAAVWMDAVDPAADPAFVRAQRQAFEGWRSVPVEDLHYEVVPEAIGDLGGLLTQRLVGRHGDGTYAVVEVERRYRLRGFDDRDMIEFEYPTLRQAPDGQWRLVALDDLRFLGLDSAVTTWELGPVRVRATEHFLVISAPDQAGRADELAATAEQAHQRFSARWPLPWSNRLPLVLPRSVEELEQVLQTTFDLTNFVAFVAYDVDRDEGRYETTAPRIYIQDRNLSRHGQQFQLDTLVHELVHAASSALSGPYSEAWVQEGFAEWFTNGQAVVGRLPAAADGRPNDPHEFNTGTQRQIIGSYDESEALMAVLAGRTSRDDVFEFFAALGARRSVAGTADHNADVALRESTGLGLGELTAAAR